MQSRAKAQTLMLRAEALLQVGKPRDAVDLLEQASHLARDQSNLAGRVWLALAVAQEMLANDELAVKHARRALWFDSDVRSRIAEFADKCRQRGKTDFADRLMALKPGEEPDATAGKEKQSRYPAGVLVTALLIVVAVAVSISIIQWSSGGNGGWIDAERIRQNVGLLIVSVPLASDEGGTTIMMPLSSGSCFAISRNGFLLTNRHVTKARHRRDVSYKLGERDFGRNGDDYRLLACFGPDPRDHVEASLVYESPYRDVALLKVDRVFPQHFTVAPAPEPGDKVFAAGFPGLSADFSRHLDPDGVQERIDDQLGSGELDFTLVAYGRADFEVTITSGVVSAVRAVEGVQWFQHEAVISHGSSGGPLVSPPGSVVGLNTLIEGRFLRLVEKDEADDRSKGVWAPAEGFGFALGLAQLKAELSPYVELP